MNKLFKISILGILILFFANCKSPKEVISISHIKSNDLVIVRLALEDSTIISVKFPNKIQITNNSKKQQSFVKFNYSYQDSLSKWRNLGIDLIEIKNNNYRSVSTRGEKTIKSKSSLSFLYYTRHFLDSTKSIQQKFKPYITKMLNENKDTLHINTVKEFKKTHKEIFERLTKNDSISIQFLDNKKLGERITIPVKW